MSANNSRGTGSNKNEEDSKPKKRKRLQKVRKQNTGNAEENDSSDELEWGGIRGGKKHFFRANIEKAILEDGSSSEEEKEDDDDTEKRKCRLCKVEIKSPTSDDEAGGGPPPDLEVCQRCCVILYGEERCEFCHEKLRYFHQMVCCNRDCVSNLTDHLRDTMDCSSCQRKNLGRSSFSLQQLEQFCRPAGFLAVCKECTPKEKLAEEESRHVFQQWNKDKSAVFELRNEYGIQMYDFEDSALAISPANEGLLDSLVGRDCQLLYAQYHLFGLEGCCDTIAVKCKRTISGTFWVQRGNALVDDTDSPQNASFCDNIIKIGDFSLDEVLYFGEICFDPSSLIDFCGHFPKTIRFMLCDTGVSVIPWYGCTWTVYDLDPIAYDATLDVQVLERPLTMKWIPGDHTACNDRGAEILRAHARRWHGESPPIWLQNRLPFPDPVIQLIHEFSQTARPQLEMKLNQGDLWVGIDMMGTYAGPHLRAKVAIRPM